MKNVTIGIPLVIIMIIAVMIISSNDSKTIRNTQINQSLENSINSTIETLLLKESYSIDNSEEFISDCIEAMAAQLKSKAAITINVLDADLEKGLLSIEIVEKFKYPNGKEGSVSAVRTVILDKSEENSVDNSKCDISFVVKGDVYKSYIMPRGSRLIIPPLPKKEDKTYEYWECDGVKLDSNVIITCDMTIIAK